MLYDMLGREIPKSIKTPDERQITSVELRDRYGDYPSRRLTPQKLSAIFTEADQGSVGRQAELFEEMLEKDLHLFSVMSTRISAVSKLDWEILPSGDDARARETADFVREAIEGLDDFEDNLKDILDAIGKGFAALEILWELQGGSHLPVKLQWAEQKKFNWINALYPRVRTPANQWPGEELAPWKWVFHVHKTASGWAPRQGLLRRCAWWYIFRNYAVKDWVAFAEIFGQPLRVGKYDVSASETDKETLLRAVRELGSDAAAIISKATDIEFVEAQARTSGKSIYESLMDYGAAEMSKGVLGHSAAADSTPGKLGNEQQATSVRRDIAEDDAEQIMKTLRRDLVRPIVIFKFGPDTPLPWFKLKYEPEEDKKAEADLYSVHLHNGFPVSIESYAAKFNLPVPKDGEVLLNPSSPGNAGFQPGQAANDGATVLANRETPPAPPLGKGRKWADCGCVFVGKDGNPAPDPVDMLAGNLLAHTNMAEQIDPVKKLMAECATLEEFRDRLLEAYAGMATVQLGNLMAQATAVAELYGRYSAIADKSVRATGGGA
jgi:phage gp29-like protein